MKYSFPKCYTTFRGILSLIRRDTLHWSEITLTRDIVTELDPITNFDFIGFHTTVVMGAARQEKTNIPPDTWSYPILMLRPVSLVLFMFPHFEFRTMSKAQQTKPIQKSECQ